MASKAAKGRRPSGRDCHARWKSTTTRASPENPDRCPASAPPESEDLVTELGQTPIIWCVQLDGSSVVGRKGMRRAAGSGHLVGNNAHFPLFPFQLASFPQSPGTPSGLTARTMVRCTGHVACVRIAPCRARANGPGQAEATLLLRPRPNLLRPRLHLPSPRLCGRCRRGRGRCGRARSRLPRARPYLTRA